MSPAPMTQEPRQGEHCRTNPPNDDEQMGEINMIFKGSMSITSKTQGKKARAGDQPDLAHRARENDEVV
jgi:hypothetical protein